MRKLVSFFIFSALTMSCTQQAKNTPNQEKLVAIPAFSADTAYSYVKSQVDFGARVPNTKAHDECASYLSNQLKKTGAEVILQKADLQAFDGNTLHSTNIIGSFNPATENRILLCSHWDSRPWADNDPEPKNRKEPVMAANDGASGVGILLEIARQIGKSKPEIGVDIIFLDTEDYGAPSEYKGEDSEKTWCLGTQYWAQHPHVPGYRARFGILLDMVGAPGARFYKEQASVYYASNIVDKVWSQAGSLGFGQYFINDKGGAITDDHIFINQIAGVPCIDIIHYDPNSGSGFGTYWHTTHDTMDNVDKNTLMAVGTTLMNIIYKEK